MKKQVLIGILCFSLCAGFGTAAEIARRCPANGAAPKRVAFFTLLYERPNPERLPVKVTFRFL